MKLMIRNLFFLILFSLFLCFCDAKKSAKYNTNDNPTETLLKQQDCGNCHADDHTNTGPSYNKIANRYIHYTQDTVTMLASRIIKGSVGIWGQIPMTQHPTLSQNDAEKLVLFILQKVK